MFVKERFSADDLVDKLASDKDILDDESVDGDLDGGDTRSSKGKGKAQERRFGRWYIEQPDINDNGIYTREELNNWATYYIGQQIGKPVPAVSVVHI